jgi:hypothetical protein
VILTIPDHFAGAELEGERAKGPLALPVKSQEKTDRNR